ncbi:MAG: hypothetical protein IPN94_09995 [Sphingobacteriales bacterium]|nr:hypothetical protein [Sphingobacteriales bacterium]
MAVHQTATVTINALPTITGTAISCQLDGSGTPDAQLHLPDKLATVGNSVGCLAHRLQNDGCTLPPTNYASTNKPQWHARDNPWGICSDKRSNKVSLLQQV